jgi:hypothetical protein
VEGAEGIGGAGAGEGAVRVATGDDRIASNGGDAALGEVYHVATGVPTGTGPSWRVPESTSSSKTITSGGVLEAPALAGSDTPPVPFGRVYPFLTAVGMAGTGIGEDENLGTGEGTEAGRTGCGR